MSTQTRSGFTIIEVMLFLAVSGALTVGILVSSGAAINRQRYQDSVNSFKGVIQEQYNHVTNVINGDATNPTCTASGTVLSLEESAQARGTSKCLVMGRFLLIESTQTTAYDLIGQPPENTDETGDTSVLGEYAWAVRSPETRAISWGAKIMYPKAPDEVLTETPGEVLTGVLIVRSPISGAILTYVKDLTELNLKELSEDERLAPVSGSVAAMINDGNMQQKELCVDSDGGLSVLAKRMAVRIKERAASPTAVEVARESDNICDK